MNQLDDKTLESLDSKYFDFLHYSLQDGISEADKKELQLKWGRHLSEFGIKNSEWESDFDRRYGIPQ